MVTSASDGFARVWSDKGELKSIFKQNNMLMTSKWNKDSSLIASGGQERKLQVWQPSDLKKQNKLLKTY